MIVAKKKFDLVSAGASHVTHWQSKKVRVEILNPIEVTHANGELHEREGVFEAFKLTARDADGGVRPIGCPAPVGTVKVMRHRDKNGKVCGRLHVIATQTEPYIGDDGRPMWAIEWRRAGTKQRPIPDDSSGVYLAHEHGYTSSPSRAMDPEAPVIPTESVAAAIADDKAFLKEQRRQRLIESKQRAQAVMALIEEALLDLEDDVAA